MSINEHIAAIARQFNAELRERYANDQVFRRQFNEHLRDIGVPIEPEPSRERPQ